MDEIKMTGIITDIEVTVCVCVGNIMIQMMA